MTAKKCPLTLEPQGISDFVKNVISFVSFISFIASQGDSLTLRLGFSIFQLQDTIWPRLMRNVNEDGVTMYVEKSE